MKEHSTLKEYVVLLGRESPYSSMRVSDEKIDGIIIETYSMTYLETYATVPLKLLEKIANYYHKKVEELSEREIREYLLEVEKIDERLEGKLHVTTIDW